MPTGLPGEVLHGGVVRLELHWNDPSADGRPFDLSYYRVAPGDRCTLHVHTGKTETWVFVDGVGRVVRGDEELDVAPGDAVRTPPGLPHAMVNTGPTDLVFVSVVETAPGAAPTTIELEGDQ